MQKKVQNSFMCSVLYLKAVIAVCWLVGLSVGDAFVNYPHIAPYVPTWPCLLMGGFLRWLSVSLATKWVLKKGKQSYIIIIFCTLYWFSGTKGYIAITLYEAATYVMQIHAHYITQKLSELGKIMLPQLITPSRRLRTVSSKTKGLDKIFCIKHPIVT